jgi:hypothetical protein
MLCTPAMVYVILACLSILAGLMGSISSKSLIAKGIYAILWTWILNLLCEKGYPTISWILVFLPFIVMFGVVALLDKSQTQTQTPSIQTPSYQPSYPMLHR